MLLRKYATKLPFYVPNYEKHDFYFAFQIFIEADLDEDNQLSFAEFEHVISKAPDFVEYV